MGQAGGLNLLGPANCTGDALLEKTGSMIKLSGPTWITAVECPIQVYLISFCCGRVQFGLNILSYLSSYSWSHSRGSFLISGCYLLYLLNSGSRVVSTLMNPWVMMVSLSYSNLKSNCLHPKKPTLMVSEGLKYLSSFFSCLMLSA